MEERNKRFKATAPQTVEKCICKVGMVRLDCPYFRETSSEEDKLEE